jgi:hypothetical protein
MMADNSTNTNKAKEITSRLKSLNTKKTMTYDIENPGSGLFVQGCCLSKIFQSQYLQGLDSAFSQTQNSLYFLDFILIGLSK